jgi:hypothetical protein
LLIEELVGFKTKYNKRNAEQMCRWQHMVWVVLRFMTANMSERKRYDEKGKNISLLPSWIKFVNLEDWP